MEELNINRKEREIPQLVSTKFLATHHGCCQKYGNNSQTLQFFKTTTRSLKSQVCIKTKEGKYVGPIYTSR